jgi:hypothetical protein
VLLLLAAIFYIFKWQWLSCIFGTIAGLIFIVLMILIRIELYQDQQDYLKWREQNYDM